MVMGSFWGDGNVKLIGAMAAQFWLYQDHRGDALSGCVRWCVSYILIKLL